MEFTVELRGLSRLLERVKARLVDVREAVIRGAVAVGMMIYLLLFEREGYR